MNYVRVDGFGGNAFDFIGFHWFFRRFSKLGVIPTEHRNRCQTRLFVVRQPSAGFFGEFNHGPSTTGRIAAQPIECKERAAGHRKRDADHSIQWKSVACD